MGEIHHFKIWSVNRGEWIVPSMKLGVKAIAELNGVIIPGTMEKIGKSMPKGPKGEKRPADVIGAAILVGRIATGDAEDRASKTPNRAKGGKAGGAARAKSMPSARRKEIAKAAAKARWEG